MLAMKYVKQEGVGEGRSYCWAIWDTERLSFHASQSSTIASHPRILVVKRNNGQPRQ